MIRLLMLIVWTTLVSGNACCGEPAAPRRASDDQKAQVAYVLLKNGHVLTGTAKQEGSRIVIHQNSGATLRLPIERVACWGPDKRSLYDYRVDQRKSPSLKNHFVDARWCIANGLKSEAALEIMSIYRSSPGNLQAKQLEELLRKPDVQIKQPVAQEIAPPDETASSENLITAEASFYFTKFVQPVLINRCGACHDSSKNHEFTLRRLPGVRRVSASMTTTNLQHVMSWINFDDFRSSLLLEYAGKPHGGLKSAPLNPEKTGASDSLRYWIDRIVQERGSTQAVRPISTATQASPFADQLSVEPESSTKMGEGDKITRLPSVGDPFDPAAFNKASLLER